MTVMTRQYAGDDFMTLFAALPLQRCRKIDQSRRHMTVGVFLRQEPHRAGRSTRMKPLTNQVRQPSRAARRYSVRHLPPGGRARPVLGRFRLRRVRRELDVAGTALIVLGWRRAGRERRVIQRSGALKKGNTAVLTGAFGERHSDQDSSPAALRRRWRLPSMLQLI